MHCSEHTRPESPMAPSFQSLLLWFVSCDFGSSVYGFGAEDTSDMDHSVRTSPTFPLSVVEGLFFIHVGQFRFSSSLWYAESSVSVSVDVMFIFHSACVLFVLRQSALLSKEGKFWARGRGLTCLFYWLCSFKGTLSAVAIIAVVLGMWRKVSETSITLTGCQGFSVDERGLTLQGLPRPSDNDNTDLVLIEQLDSLSCHHCPSLESDDWALA